MVVCCFFFSRLVNMLKIRLLIDNNNNNNTNCQNKNVVDTMQKWHDLKKIKLNHSIFF